MSVTTVIKIETYWNVNESIKIFETSRVDIKIETYWNVNWKAHMYFLMPPCY